MVTATNMTKGFQILDHTADIGVTAYGRSIEELFCNAALALFSLVTDLETVEERAEVSLEVKSQDVDGLLVEWLNELIYSFDVNHMLFKRFDIESLIHNEVNELKATCHGEKFDPLRHKITREIKAATYHMLKLKKNRAGYQVQVIFDI